MKQQEQTNHGRYAARVTVGDTLLAKAHRSIVAAATHTTTLINNNNKGSSGDEDDDNDNVLMIKKALTLM
ncbi:MAG TPA: hypothetical protein VHF28_07080 [Nitrososphaera sp.]|nr:hypothetical protein [Nitrososphaera sp.]